MNSLQNRLSAGLLASLIVVFSLLWWLTGTTLRYLAEDYLAEHLQHDGESILNALEIGGDDRLFLDLSKVEPVYARKDSGHYYAVIGAGTTIRSPSLGQGQFDIPAMQPGQLFTRYQAGENRQPLLIRAENHVKNGVPITVVTGEDLSPTLTRIARVQRQFSLVAVPLLALLIGVQVAILRVGFRPLKRIRAQLQALEQSKRHSLDTNVPSEVAALVVEVNRLLQILQQRLENSRNTLSDLAHALKTPLTVIQQLTYESALEKSPEIASSLRVQVLNMHRLMDRVLKRGRLAGRGPVPQAFDAHREIADLVHTITLMHREKSLDIVLDLGSSRLLPLDREDMLELAGILLDNACKWAKEKIRLRLTADDREVRLVVEDDGPGVPETDLQALSERGTRLDESVAGHGLGLAIARYIAEQYDGNLSFKRSPSLGGLSVTAVLRLHSSARNA